MNDHLIMHDTLVKMTAMTAAELANDGESLDIRYSFCGSRFGEIIMASTQKGICYGAFADEGQSIALGLLKNFFPNSKYAEGMHREHESILRMFVGNEREQQAIHLHVKATPFRLKVWEALLRVRKGTLTNYSALAQRVGYPGASRAVGSAVADNPVAIIIPCHRVTRLNGETGQYHWGSARKQAIIQWEHSATRQLAMSFENT